MAEQGRRLEELAALSREFGTVSYVKGGGGNTSLKDSSTLWVKPSGRTLSEMTPDAFVALDRSRLAKLYSVTVPEDPHAREEMVKEIMAGAVRPDSRGRPSVEAALHDSFEAVFVVHVHPPLVNGMTCAREGEAGCRRLFPEALWIPYQDPGYTLCMACRREMRAYAETRGHEPGIVFLQNHGLIVAADTAETIRRTIQRIMGVLRDAYSAAGIEMTLTQGSAPSPETERRLRALLRAVKGDATTEVVSAGPCSVAEGPVTPDHICFSGSYPLKGEPAAASIAAYREQHGRDPMVIACEDGVFGIGPDRKAAELALVFALDGALVRQLTEAFGGIGYMDDRARRFIEDWEVEAYRRRIAAQDATPASRRISG